MTKSNPTPQFPLFEDPIDSTKVDLTESMESSLRSMKSELTFRMKCGKRTTKEQKSAIIAAYASGEPISRLSEKTGFSMRSIRLILIKEGIQRRPRGNAARRFSTAEIEDIRRRWHTDEPRLRIAKTLNISPPTLNRILKEIGEDPRRKMPKGKTHSQWKGGRIIDDSGYVSIHPSTVDHPEIAEAMVNQIGYVREHRYVVACQVGRPLRRDESVHHINGVKSDNRPENLQLRVKQHGTGQKFRCADCGSHNIEAVELDD